jgi:putative nucleotidyltransferase-like protein
VTSSRGAFSFHPHLRAVDTAEDPPVKTVARTLVLDGLAAECVSSLRANGIRALLLKGPVTSRWLYRGRQFRGYLDVDLLVAGADFQEASRVLLELGFRDAEAGLAENEINTHANTFALERPPLDARFPTGLAVDLHVTYHGIQAPNSAFWALAAEGADRIRIAGTDIEVPGEPIRTLLVALHAGTSGPFAPKALADLDHALERMSDETWSEAYALAQRLDAVPRFVAGLTLRPLGRELIDRLCIDARIDMASALHSLGSWTGAGAIERLRKTPGVRRRIRLLARELVPTPSFIRAWSPFPGRGVLGLALGYCYRLFWLPLKLPAALRAHARARRVASAGRAAEPGRE